MKFFSQVSNVTNYPNLIKFNYLFVHSREMSLHLRLSTEQHLYGMQTAMTLRTVKLYLAR